MLVLDFQHLKLSGHFAYHQIQLSKVLRSDHRLNLRVFFESWNKQRLYFYIGQLYFITETQCVYCAVRTTCLSMIHINCILSKVKHSLLLSEGSEKFLKIRFKLQLKQFLCIWKEANWIH